jgi:phospholipid/cholesterol/gamma-HCH transport system permease protein
VFSEALYGALSPAINFVRSIGEHMSLLGQAVYWTFRRPFRWRLLADAMEYHGVGSLPIICLVATFTGMVFSLQLVQAFRNLGAEGFAASAVGLALSLELAPVMTALMISGRVGAGIATELGTMRITEQIDALETMAVSPVQYLIVPRLIAGLIMTPVLQMLFFALGMLGAYLIAVPVLGVDHGSFVERFEYFVDPQHLAQGLIKSAVFGVAITLIGCYQGYNASGGGRGVGLATTRAVVIGSVTTIALDYFLSDILRTIFPVATK